jgi:ankyrin repeat protein
MAADIVDIDELEREWLLGIDGKPLSKDEPRSRLFTTLKPDPKPEQKMLLACRDGDLEAVKRIYAENPESLYEQDGGGLTPLQTALMRARYDVSSYLLDVSDEKSLKLQDSIGNRALHYAVYCRSPKLVIRMVDELKCDIFDTSTTKTTNRAIHLAMMSGSTEVVDVLIKRGASCVDVVECGPSPAWSAVVQDRLEVFKRCFAENPKILQEKDGEREDVTVAWHAVLWGATRIVRWLLEEGHMKLEAELSPGVGGIVVNAALNGCLELLKHVHQKGANMLGVKQQTQEGAVTLAASQGFLETVQWLESIGCPLYALDDFGSTPLTLACCTGHLEVAQYIYKARGPSTSLELDGESQHTCLGNAASNNHVKVMTWLLDEMKVSVHTVDRTGFTALHLAAERGHVPAIDLLLQHGADSSVQVNNLKYYPSAFLLAVVNGHVKAMERLYEHNKEHLFDLTQYRRNALISACLTDNLAAAKWLVEQDTREITSFDAYDEGRLTMKPFIVGADGVQIVNPHLLVTFGELVDSKCDGIFEWFWELGLDLNVPRRDSSTPLSLAIRATHLKLVRFLIEKAKVNVFAEDSRRVNALHLAADRGDLELFKFLAETVLAERPSYDFDVLDSSEWSPLSFAVATGSLPVVEYLAETCKAPVLKSKSNVHLLELAAHGGSVPVVKFLLAQGITIPPAEKGSPSPLLVAIRSESLEVVKYFVQELKVNLLSKPLVAHSWMREAMTKGTSLELLNWLYMEGISLYDLDDLRSNISHVAAHLGHLSYIKWAYHMGISLVTRNHDGATPIALAAYHGHTHIVKYLIRHGAVPGKNSSADLSPLELAQRKNHSELVSYIQSLGFQ